MLKAEVHKLRRKDLSKFMSRTVIILQVTFSNLKLNKFKYRFYFSIYTNNFIMNNRKYFGQNNLTISLLS